MSRTDINTGTIHHNGMTRVRSWTTKSDGVTVDSGGVTDKIENRFSSNFSKYRSGTTSPLFWFPNRKTALPFNSYQFEQKEQWGSYGETHTYQGIGSGRVQHNWSVGSSSGNAPSFSTEFSSPSSILSPAEILSLDNQARNRLASKVKDERVNLAQFYAERIQAVDMFVNTATSIVKALAALKKGNIISAAAHLGLDVSSPRKRTRLRHKVAKSRGRSNVDSTANRWLALQFGWLPLMSDVQGMAETLARSLNDVHFANASQTLIRKTEKTIPVLGPAYNKYGGFDHVSVEIKEIYVVKYQVRFHTTNALLQSAASIGLTNPLDLAWELLPFSFVVDWFLPIGKFLQNLDAYVGLGFDAGMKTVFIHQTRLGKGESQGWDSAQLNYRVNVEGVSRMSWTKHTRSRLSSFPEVPFPELRNPFSPTHIADALSLLIQHRPS